MKGATLKAKAMRGIAMREMVKNKGGIHSPPHQSLWAGCTTQFFPAFLKGVANG